MPHYNSKPVCDRCNTVQDDYTSYHDGTWTLSSIVNRRDMFGHDKDIIVFCNSCYQQFHSGMKAWLRNARAPLLDDRIITIQIDGLTDAVVSASNQEGAHVPTQFELDLEENLRDPEFRKQYQESLANLRHSRSVD